MFDKFITVSIFQLADKELLQKTLKEMDLNHSRVTFSDRKKPIESDKKFFGV